MKTDEETISSMSQRLAEQDGIILESSQTIKQMKHELQNLERCN